jgi:hypothetical protein
VPSRLKVAKQNAKAMPTLGNLSKENASSYKTMALVFFGSLL